MFASGFCPDNGTCQFIRTSLEQQEDNVPNSPARVYISLCEHPASKGGLLLVDEIDTGLHYSVMVDVWRAIAVSARDADVQVFATTHSLECIRAAQESFADSDPYDLSIHRLDRDKNGVIAATFYDREMIETALSSGLEVR